MRSRWRTTSEGKVPAAYSSRDSVSRACSEALRSTEARRAVFQFEIVHNGSNDSVSAYCEACGTMVIVNVMEAERRLG